MSCKDDPSIEQMQKDLLGGGWEKVKGLPMWRDLMGRMFYGPHRAWHIWAGTKMDGDK